jgi:hypothetical protein
MIQTGATINTAQLQPNPKMNLRDQNYVGCPIHAVSSHEWGIRAKHEPLSLTSPNAIIWEYAGYSKGTIEILAKPIGELPSDDTRTTFASGPVGRSS